MAALWYSGLAYAILSLNCLVSKKQKQKKNKKKNPVPYCLPTHLLFWLVLSQYL